MGKFRDEMMPKNKLASKEFASPSRDTLSSRRFMTPGDDYGVGHKTPVGSLTVSMKGEVPKGCRSWSPDEKA